MNSDTSPTDSESQRGTGQSEDDSDSRNYEGATQPESTDATLPIETTPTIRPVLVWMGITAVLGIVLIGYIGTNPQQFGGPDLVEVAIQVVAVVAILAEIRLAVRVFVLTRTRYRVDSDRVTRQYSLFLRTWEREVPVEMIRSSELRQSRIQKLLGYGTIAVNQGLGELQLDNIQNPKTVRDALTVLTTTDQRA